MDDSLRARFYLHAIFNEVLRCMQRSWRENDCFLSTQKVHGTQLAQYGVAFPIKGDSQNSSCFKTAFFYSPLLEKSSSCVVKAAKDGDQKKVTKFEWVIS